MPNEVLAIETSGERQRDRKTEHDLPTGDTKASAPAVLQSQDLLRGAKEVLIKHGGETYRLRITRHGKLILYK